MPFVAVWGLATDDQRSSRSSPRIDVALCWWALGRLPVAPAVRLATTIFFAFGTVFWYTAQLGTTWYQAHIVAVGLIFLAIGRGARRRSRRRPRTTEATADGPSTRPIDGATLRRASPTLRDRAAPVPRRVSCSAWPARRA